MITLYTAATANGQKAAIALEEAGLDYGTRILDLAAGEHLDASVLALNPVGRIPFIEPGDDEAGEVVYGTLPVAVYAAECSGRLLPVAEDQLGLCVYPDRRTAWHYDDKITQDYLLKAAELPVPETHVFFDRAQAEQFCRDADYPLVLKLAAGAGSSNVRLLRTPADAAAWIEQHFDAGVRSLQTPEACRSSPRSYAASG